MIAAEVVETTSDLQLWGAAGFGLVLGWYLYFLNRYRKEISLADLTTVVGAIGGAGILALFPAKTDLFGAYGVGLAVGFFGYFVVLVLLVWRSGDFGINYLIDGRRRPPHDGEEHPAGPDRPMAAGSTQPLPPGA